MNLRDINDSYCLEIIEIHTAKTGRGKYIPLEVVKKEDRKQYILNKIHEWQKTNLGCYKVTILNVENKLGVLIEAC